MPKGDAAKKRWELAEKAVARAEKKMRKKDDELTEARFAYNDLKEGGKVEAFRVVHDKMDSFFTLRDDWERKRDISMSLWLKWQRIVNPRECQC